MNEIPEPPPERVLIGSRAEYLAAAETVYGLAQRELCIFDPDLEMLGPNAPVLAEQWNRLLRRNPDNRLRIAVHESDYIQRACPRLLLLLRDFSTQVAVYRTEGVARRAQDRFILADALHYVRRPVADQPHGVHARHTPGEARALHDRFEEIWEVSEAAISATTLGL
jgi:hypothetical protein